MISHKETLFAVLRHEQTNVVPWVPFAGVHAGSLAGYVSASKSLKIANSYPIYDLQFS